jgi:two-component system nitrogen regulation response regulator GlnG
MPEHSLASEIERLIATTLPDLISERDHGSRGLYRRVIERVERPLLRHALQMAGGNQLKAARLLGINRNTLRKRLRALGLLPARPGMVAALAPEPPAA